jgi:hypothetical protein
MSITRALSFAAIGTIAASLPAQLAGTYVVGPGGNYANIAAAIAALGTGVVAPVTFLVTANDSGPWTIPSFPGQGPNNPVTFEALSAPVTIGGAQPMLTLNGCASVTFRGFSGSFTNTAVAISITGSTADCVFQNCDFTAPATTAGSVALFNFNGSSGCRIEDCTFGGSWEALYCNLATTSLTIQRNRITGGGWWIMRLGGVDVTFANNIVTGNSNYGISCGLTGTPGSGANLKVWHNSFYISHPTTSNQYCSLRWYSTAAGTEVVNNVLVDDFNAPSTSAFNMWCLGAARPTLMNYNCFWSNQPGYSVVFAGANQTLASWQGLGFDANSIQVDPQYVAPAATPPDLHLQGTSPCAAGGDLLLGVLTDFALAPRTVPVSIGAYEQDGAGTASYTVFGAGCAGSAGVVSNAMSQPPQLGTTPNIVFGNLPATNLAVAILGVSNTVSTAGPLPLPLAFLGMPGCSLRVSPDVTIAVVGAGGTGAVPFPIPNNPIFVGFTFHTQALAIDPGINAFGASMSAAATAVVGL